MVILFIYLRLSARNFEFKIYERSNIYSVYGVYAKKHARGLSNDLDPFHPSYIVRHASNAQLPAELAPFARGPFTHSLLQLDVVALAVRLLHSRHVDGVPVESDEPRNEQLAAQRVLARRTECVVEQQGVSHRSIDYAVQNMRQ